MKCAHQEALLTKKENEKLANIMHVTFSCKEDSKITKMQKF